MPAAPVTRDGDARAALAALVDHEYLRTVRYADQRVRAVENGAHLLIVEFSRAMVKRMAQLGVPMYAHTMVRIPDAQKIAFQQGRSNFDGTQPYVHQHCAVDIVHGVYHWELTRDQWNVIGHVGKEVASMRGIDIVWGGDWRRPWDPAHWELAHWRERAKEVLQ